MTNFIQSLPKAPVRTIGATVTAKGKDGKLKGRKPRAQGNGGIVKSGNYENADWNKLTYDQREEVRRLRKTNKAKRSVNAVSRNAPAAAPAAVQEPTDY